MLDKNTLLAARLLFLLQSDQNLLAPHLSTVAHEFGMNDIQRDEKLGGELAMGLFLLGAPAALAIGACADRYPRKLLLVLILLVGGAASLGTALARSYSDLFWMRALTGVSLGSALPVTFSLVGDMFAVAADGGERSRGSGHVGRRRLRTSYVRVPWRGIRLVAGTLRGCRRAVRRPRGGRLDCVRRASARRLR